jgi:tRNA threonylcarbamoyladenosine biosynthesis protein TsaB
MGTVAEPSLLILETSGRVGQVALAQGEIVRATRPLDESRRHARDLTPAVADLLGQAGWRASELDGVLVSRGPGSYTGLRVGIMSAKALAYATGCVLLAVDTFAATALQAPDEALSIDVLADAQQDRVYVQRFCRPRPGTVPTPATALTIRPFSEWLQQCDPAVWATGPGLRRHEDSLPRDYRIVPVEHWDPRPESILRLGLARYHAGERDDFWSVEPLYLRPSSAEEKWSARSP